MVTLELMVKYVVLVMLGLMVAMPVVARNGEDNSKNEIKEQRELMKETREKAREEYKTKREEAKARFEENVVKIKDARKQQLVQKLNKDLEGVCANRIKAMTNNLAAMTGMLDKLEAKTKDIPEIKTARTAVDEAYKAVNDFGAKPCSVSLTGNEQTVRSEFNAAKDKLKADLSVVRAKVEAARKAVRAAVVAVAKKMGEPLPSVTPKVNN